MREEGKVAGEGGGRKRGLQGCSRGGGGGGSRGSEEPQLHTFM